jgi:hypothetical protein
LKDKSEGKRTFARLNTNYFSKEQLHSRPILSKQKNISEHLKRNELKQRTIYAYRTEKTNDEKITLEELEAKEEGGEKRVVREGEKKSVREAEKRV